MESRARRTKWTTTACVSRMLLALAVLACAMPVQAQSTGAISGAVTDQQGAAMPGVTVIVKHVQTGVSRELVTNETGRQVSHPVGTFKGTCEVATPAAEMKALIGLACRDGAETIELHAVVQGTEVIILKLVVMDGLTPDPMDRVEVTRVKVS